VGGKATETGCGSKSSSEETTAGVLGIKKYSKDAARLRLAESATLPFSPEVSLEGSGTFWQQFGAC